MSSTVFKSVLLHGALAAIGLVAGTYGSHVAVADSAASEIKIELEQRTEQELHAYGQSAYGNESALDLQTLNGSEFSDVITGHTS